MEIEGIGGGERVGGRGRLGCEELQSASAQGDNQKDDPDHHQHDNDAPQDHWQFLIAAFAVRVNRIVDCHNSIPSVSMAEAPKGNDWRRWINQFYLNLWD